MKLNKNIRRVLSVLLIPVLLSGCVAYERVVLPKDAKLPTEEKAVILHRGADVYYLTDVKIVNEQLEATADEIPKWLDRRKKEEQLHIYVLPTAEIPEALPAKVSVPFAAIDEVVIYYVNLDKTKTYNIWAGVGIGVAALAAVIVTVLVIASCPFVYTYDGENYKFAGELFPGALHAPLERSDYLPLPDLKTIDGEYRIRLANEFQAREYTNLTELLFIDHPSNVSVSVDKYGVPHTFTDLRPPKEALTLKGEDIRDRVVAADGVTYIGDIPAEVNEDFDGLVLTFARPPHATEAKLAFRGKNYFWLDYTYNKFCELFGDFYDDWCEEQNKAPAEELRRWSLEQGIPVKVYIEEGGGWRFLDYYEIVGPLNDKMDVLSFPLGGVHSDELKVKLEFGSLFWEIDYVAVDFSADLPVRVHAVPPESAVDEKGRDVRGLLCADDGLYYVQNDVGEYASLSFVGPGPAEGVARTTVLHTKGYYEVPRDQRGKPDYSVLSSFRKPGRFIRFSKELFLDVYDKTVRREG